MKKYPYIVLTRINDPLPTQEVKNEYGHFYRMPISRLRVAIWGFEDKEGAENFSLLKLYHEGPFYIGQD